MAVSPDALGFQSALDEVLAAPPPRWLCMAGALAAGLLATLVAIAACVRTDVTVVGFGTLAADAPTIVLQPMERAIVRDLRVRPGDRVRRGQILAVLDSTFTQADLDTLTRQAAAARALILRLSAEISLAPPDRLAAQDDAGAMQAQLYLRRRQEYRLRLEGFDQALAHGAASLHAARQAAQSAAASLTVAADIAGLRQALLQTQAGSRLTYLQAEDARIEAARRRDEALGRIAELTHALDAAQADRQGFVAQWHRSAMDELIAATAEQARLQDQHAKAARLHALVQLAAPQDGTVLDVAARAAGSAAQPGEPLVTLLPDTARMIAEIEVASTDIGSVAEGDQVAVKVDAFPYQTHGFLRGQVRSVGRQSVRAPAGAPMHLVRVAVQEGRLAAIPGMTVRAEIRAGTRNLLGYFLGPVTRGFQDSFREP